METSTTPVNDTASVITEHIEITPGICGGKPRIKGHRIKVQHIALWHERMGLSADEIISEHPELTLGDVYAALAYYWDHRDRIDADIKEGHEFADHLRQGAPSIFEKARVPHASNDSRSSR
jgi:uncharacterized protein (DUF433 family)